MTNDNLQALSDAGVSIWLDDLSRDRLDSGNLAELVKVRNVVGVTTNPSIFQAAMSKGNAYDDQIEKLANLGTLPARGFYVSCFPVKIARASAGWCRAVAILGLDGAA